MMSGTRAASACSAARVTFSPTTAPIEPPMNPKSMTQIATGRPSMAPVPHTRRVAHAGRGLGRREPVRVRLLVDEAERVDRLEARRRALDQVSGSSSCSSARRRRQPEVVAAGRADPHRLVELLVEQHRLARRALRPQVGRVGVPAGAERRQLDRHQSSRPRATARTARAIGCADGPAPAPGDAGGAGEREGGRGEARRR